MTVAGSQGPGQNPAYRPAREYRIPSSGEPLGSPLVLSQLCARHEARPRSRRSHLCMFDQTRRGVVK